MSLIEVESGAMNGGFCFSDDLDLVGIHVL